MRSEAVPGPEDVIIREAATADLAPCARIICEWIDETAWMPHRFTAAQIEDLMFSAKENGRTILVADNRGKVVAYISLDRNGFIHAIYLDREFRGQGIGKRLLDEARIRFDLLELTVFESNTGARRFYEREGFHYVTKGRVLNEEEGLHTLLMQWTEADA